ncbi:DUF2325 domain-containing protein [Arboricoccus pini]|nr:DUF2325 domain-containing protein [Arboricoccus pini]
MQAGLLGRTIGGPATLDRAAAIAAMPATLRRELGLETVAAQPALSRRRSLWELDSVLHCSIIGTCLTTGELRAIMGRVDPALKDRQAHDDHDVHHAAVLAAGRPEKGGKLLHKALDLRFAGKIRQFAQAEDEAALVRLWKRHLDEGDVPGAYWAALSHPALRQDSRARIFGDVHMLSHLVGASNRAALKQLQALEAANATLAEERQRLRADLQAMTAQRDRLERELHRERAAGLAHEQLTARLTGQLQDRASMEAPRELQAARAAEATARGQAIDLASELSAERQRRSELEAALADAQAEIDVLTRLPQDEAEAPLDLAGGRVLLVGGRTGQAAHARAFVERRGGRFAHHDGGLERSCAQLPALASQADIVLVPVDCVSHEAAQLAKKAAQHAGAAFMPLPRSGLGTLARALAGWTQQRRDAAMPSESA